MPVWPLTGRAEELDAVLGHVRGRGVVLAGAAGVGKTRLAREALGHAHSSGRVVRFVAATASARSVPLGAFADYATRLGDDPLARVGEVIEAVTRSPDGAPLVVAIDDAHLLDEQSALVAHHIVRRGLAPVVLTVRSGEPAADAITALWKDQLLPRMDLQPLSRTETGDLLEAVLDGPVETATAERLWRYTRGNVLYLRQLLNDELGAKHLAQRSGVWIWDGEPAVSSTLAELIDANIGRQPERVLDVLDALAVAEPLELNVLANVVSEVAIEETEAANLITIDTSADCPVARLAHPMYGEVRRARAPALRLRRLRSAIIAASPPLTGVQVGDVQLSRRAVLLLESDTAPHPTMMINAADAAVRLMDPAAGQRFAECAVRNGGGRRAQWRLMNALANGSHVAEALAVNEDLLSTSSTDSERVRLKLTRAGIFMRQGSIGEATQQLEAIEDLALATGFERPFKCTEAFVHASTRPRIAVEAALSGLTGTGPLPETAEFTGILGLITGCSALGRVDTIHAYIDRAYSLATTPHVLTGRFSMYVSLAEALCMAGLLDEAMEVSERIAQAPAEFPLALAFIALTRASVALARGDLTTARRSSAEAAAVVEISDLAWIRPFVRSVMTAAAALAGDIRHAGDDPDGVMAQDESIVRLTAAVGIAEPWMLAAQGHVTEAIALVNEAGLHARAACRPAREVWLLQAAAQFGDAPVGDRLAELVTAVQGPRAPAVAAHAAALRDSDGDGLLSAARMYEDFGDRIAAGDAAAQAAVVHREQGRRGAAMTATAFSRRLADETGADTPALRANNSPIPITNRQREIIALAAQGMPNRQIAERLTMSVRTVEGHILRASQRTGVNGREELIRLLNGR